MARLRYYELVAVEYDDVTENEFRIASAAIVCCSLCNFHIDGSGGPGNGPVCIPCADVLRQGKLRGSVIWEPGEHSKATTQHKEEEDL